MKRKEQLTIHQPNLRHRILWLLNKLVFNLFAWNILLRLFMFLSYLVNPEIDISGAKIFRIMYENGLVPISMASVLAFNSWLFEDVLFYKYLAKKSLGILFLCTA